MGYLDKKMRRDLWRMKGRAIASVLLITLGSMLYVSFMTMMPSVQTFFYDFHEGSNFTDLEVYVNGSSMSVVDELENLDGVEAVEPRLVLYGALETSESQNVTAQIYGINSSRELLINKLTITKGEYLDSSYPNEILLEKSFAKTHEIDVGDEVTMFILQQRYTFTVRGLAVSPEFLFWSVDPQAMIPLPGTLAVVFMPLETLQQAHPAFTGAVNQFSFLLENGWEDEAARGRVLDSLENKTVVLTKEDIPAYTIIKEDLEQGEGSTGAMSLIFLLVAFFVVYSAYARLIASQRREIGVLRGLGYSRKRVLLSYVYIAAIMGLVGSALGVILSIPVGYYLSIWYVESIFGLTLGTVHFEISSAIVGLLFGPITAGLAAGLATISIIRLEAHEAIRGSTVDMKPVKKTILERIFGLFRGKKLSYATVYMCRNLSRRKIRSALMVGAIGGSFVLGVLGPGTVDAFVYSIDMAVEDIEKWDLLVEFSGIRNESQLGAISSPSVESYEPVLRLSGTLEIDGESAIGPIVGIPLDSQLHKFKIVKGRVFSNPNQTVITKMMASELGAGVGDTVTVKEFGDRQFEITGIAKDLLEGLFISIEDARTMMGGDYVTALYVTVSDGQISEAEDYFRTYPGVSTITKRTEVSKGLKDFLESFTAAMYVFSLIGIIMTVLVVTNIVMVSVMERYVEYGQMKAIGYRQRTIRRIVLSETLILATIGVIVGIPLYWLSGEWFAIVMEEFFSFYQNVLTWPPILGMAIVTVIVALLAALPAVRYLGKMKVATVISERQFG
jgi:putative ABC transport system permease protein